MGFATAVVPVRLGCEAVVADWNRCTQNKSEEREGKLSPSALPFRKCADCLFITLC